MIGIRFPPTAPQVMGGKGGAVAGYEAVLSGRYVRSQEAGAGATLRLPARRERATMVAERMITRRTVPSR
jgi:hypothetical protein